MSVSPESLEQRILESGLPALLEQLCDSDDPAEADVNLDAMIELARREAMTEPESASAILDACTDLGRRYDRADVAPRVDYLRARLQLIEGSPGNALELIERSRRGWQQIGRPLDAMRTDLGRMNVLDDLGRHEDAIGVGERLLHDLDALSCSPGDGTEVGAADDENAAGWLRAATHENLGAAYGYTGRHGKAIEAYDLAQVEYRRLGDEADVARCEANRGVERVAMGFALDGHADVLRAAEVFDRIGDRHSYAKCLGHLADAELLLGAYTDCLEHIADARAVFSELGAEAEAARLAVKACRCYLSLNLLTDAIDVGRRAEEALSDQGLRHDLAEVRLLMAIALRADGDLDAALQQIDRSVEGAAASDDTPLRVRALSTRSRVLTDLGKLDEALVVARQSLDLARQGHWPSEELAARLQLSRLVEADSADHLAAAERLAEEVDLPQLRYSVHMEQARRARRDGRLGVAADHFEQAVEIVERVRNNIGDAWTRTAFLEGRTAAHDELLATVLRVGDDDSGPKAFGLAERSKARTLFDMMSGGTAAASPGDDQQPGAAEIQADLDACYRSLLGGTGIARNDRRALQQRANELETLLTRMRLEDRNAGFTKLDPLLVPTEPVVPGADEQVVEYHVCDGDLVAFVWSGGDLRIVTELPPLDQARTLVNAWARQCERFELASTLPAQPKAALTDAANKTLEQIWVALFEPVARHLVPAGELLVVPYGPLHAVPFHALSGPDGRVGETWTVSLAPSYTVAAALSDRDRSQGRSVVVGVPDDAAPAVATEAVAVAGLLGDAELLLGETATGDRLRDSTRQVASVLHIACHGMHRSQNPMFSALRLADGWLTAHDVASMAFPNSLIVLSACESGRHGGEKLLVEPLGLPRSFLAAGASAVVVSLWRADDSVAAETMIAFYHHLKEHDDVTPAAALQRAQRDVLDNHPHPAAWAPFTIHGGLGTKGPS